MDLITKLRRGIGRTFVETVQIDHIACFFKSGWVRSHVFEDLNPDAIQSELIRLISSNAYIFLKPICKQGTESSHNRTNSTEVLAAIQVLEDLHKKQIDKRCWVMLLLQTRGIQNHVNCSVTRCLEGLPVLVSSIRYCFGSVYDRLH